jgi:signal transduction histidine kinase/CheY-like chemotaxis protein
MAGFNRSEHFDSVISYKQIEAMNLNRIMVICIGCISFELLNLLNPTFWALPNLWPGAIYIVVISLFYLSYILWIKKHGGTKHYKLLNNSFWIAVIVGVLPFLANDAATGDRPLNCAVLCTVMIGCPLLETKDLNIIFSAALVANVIAPLMVGKPISVYYLEVIVITVCAYLLAHNLHQRYFRILDEQKRQYDDMLTAQKKQQELSEQLEKEQDANAAKTRFLSLMSHDLRTPLSAVISLSELGKEGNLPDEDIKRYFEEIHNSGIYLLDIINDVLDMSKIESQKMTLKPQTYGLEEFCSNMHDSIELLCIQKQITFTMVAEREQLVPYVLTDKTRFNQIFLNLLTNSVKYTQSGGNIEFDIEPLSRKDDTVRYNFIVKDNGIGMSKEFLDHAFEPFVQEHENENNSGTGLGLSIVKSLVDLMKGTVSIESTQGKGTTVTVTLDLKAVDALPETKSNQNDSIADILKGKHILVCEDNQINAEIVMLILQKYSVITDHAANGKEGLELFAGSAVNSYDAVLMDIRMPLMDGFETARAIRALKRDDAACVPIIALTANAFEDDRQHCLDAGMNDHISKPIERGQFLQTLCTQISNCRKQTTSELHT